MCLVGRANHKMWPLSPPCSTRARWSTEASGVGVPEQERGSNENKSDPGLTEREREADPCVCECHTQCMSHERCAPMS